jgi:hypothetical protein
LQDTTCVILNTEDLEFSLDDISLKTSNGQTFKPTTLDISKETLQAIMVFEETLQQGKTYNLEINFSADIRKDLRGFYISSYNCFTFYL